MTDTTLPAHAPIGQARIAGAALLAAAVAAVALMAHHPTNANPQLLPLVHGALLTALCVQALGLLYLCALRGFLQAPILAGLVAYSVSMFANMGAGLMNGFVTPRILADGPQIATPEILSFAWAINQSLAMTAVFAAGAASLLWGMDLVRDASARVRLVGSAGVLAGAAPPLLLTMGLIEMDVPGAIIFYSTQSAWALLVGWLLVTGKAGRSGMRRGG